MQNRRLFSLENSLKNIIFSQKLVIGEKSFFLQPGEKLENGIQDVYVLGEDEGVILKCIETFRDEQFKCDRNPGDRWMIKGPW